MMRLSNIVLNTAKYALIVCAIISLLLLESCSYMSGTRYDKETDMSETIDEEISNEISKINELHDEIAGERNYTVFHIKSAKGYDSNPCYMDSFDDILYITFGNYTPTTNFILKLFLDCEEVEYIVDDVQTDSYVFSLEREDIKTFKVKIVTDKDMSTTHELVTAVFLGPDTHICDLNATENKYGCVYHNTLLNDNCEKQESPEPDEPEEYLDLFYQGIVIGNQIDKRMDTVYIPPNEITVKCGETVKLSYRAGCYTDGVDNIALILMMDWQPIQFQGKDYIYIKNDPEKVSYGVLEFTAPMECGKYELTSFVIADPYGDKWPSMCDLGYRITLIVE